MKTYKNLLKDGKMRQRHEFWQNCVCSEKKFTPNEHLLYMDNIRAKFHVCWAWQLLGGSQEKIIFGRKLINPFFLLYLGYCRTNFLKIKKGMQWLGPGFKIGINKTLSEY